MSFQKGSLEKKGNGKYLLRYRVRDAKHPNGWRKEAELIKAPTDKTAEKERDRRMREINRANEVGSIEEGEPPNVPTFDEFSKGLWLVYLKNKRVKHSTIDSYSSVLRHHILPVFEKKRLNEITPAELSIFFDKLGQKLSTKFILNIYAQLRVMFEVALENDLIDNTPVRRKLHRPRHHAKKKPALSPEQIQAVLDNVPDKWKAFFICLALTNVRIGELLALRWSDVDWMGRKLTVSKSVWRGKLNASTKTDAELVKHLPDSLFRVLQWHRQVFQHKAESDFIFCKLDGNPYDPNFVRDSVLYPAMDRVGIERGPRTHGFHIFRHSAGSIIHKVTGSVKLAQIQLRHADMGTTANTYVHTDEEQSKYAAEVLANEINPTFCPPICPPEVGGLPTKGVEAC
jgi:integrase